MLNIYTFRCYIVMQNIYDENEPKKEKYSEDYTDLEDTAKKDIYDVPEDVIEETETNPLVKKFQYFFDRYYKTKLEMLIQEYPSKESLFIDFSLIEQFDPSLADELIERPEYVFEAMNIAAKRYKSSLLEDNKDNKEFEPILRVGNLPKDKRTLIKKISSDKIEKLICFEGIVKQFTTVLPKIKVAHWICKKCGNEIDLHQDGLDIKKPKMCPECKHKDFFLDEKNSEFQDFQKLEVQDLLEELKGGEQASTIHVYVYGDLVNTFTAGERLIITGILKLRTPHDLKQSVFGHYVLCSSIESSKQDFETVEITKEDEEKIKEFSKNPEIYNLLIDSIAPHITGHKEVKESIALQLFGGVRKILQQKSKVRGNIHILLVGDPGTGKSQLLLATSRIAPKSIYVAGKTATGTGLTATAVKDEFGEGGWTLKAGALVLANGGFAMIDEFDKMNADDRSAMHEALEQESYHKDFEIMLSDGTKQKIGVLVDSLMQANKQRVIYGKDCEILKTNNLEVVTTDFKKTYPIKVDRISRHLAPRYFYEIEYSNGRKIRVTPNHPVFVLQDNEFVEKPANKVKSGMFCPYTFNYSLRKPVVVLDTNIKIGQKGIVFPKKISVDLGALLGYIVTEDKAYIDNKKILNKIYSVFSKSFETKLNRTVQKALYEFLEKNFKEILEKSPKRRIPKKIFQSSEKVQRSFLSAAFEGNGFINSERFGYSTMSKGLAEDYQDLLLNLRVFSQIQTERIKNKKHYKVVILGYKSKKEFLKLVPVKDKRYYKIKAQINKSAGDLALGYLTPTEIEKMTKNKLKSIVEQLLKVKNITNSSVDLISIKKIRKIKNKDSKWTYDLTVEPTRTFLTGGLILHNTVSIAKAGIVTAFKTETSVLAAANPKYGRFDAYKTIPEQIEIPPTLMSRFDLVFVLQDIVDEKKDLETVNSILRTQKSGELLQKSTIENLNERDSSSLEKISTTSALDPEFLKKYIAYGRTRVFPVLTENAIKIIRKFFISLRQKSQGGRVTVTFRQLEALVRLAEASAKIRLSETVSKEDANRAISLYKKSMEQVGLDPETGTFDIDIITTGQSHNQSTRMMKIVEVINNIVKEQSGQCAKFDTIVKEAEKEGLDKIKVRDLIEKLQKIGDIYEPRNQCFMTTKKD